MLSIARVLPRPSATTTGSLSTKYLLVIPSLTIRISLWRVNSILIKAKELLAQAGLSGGFDTTMISIPFANKDVTVAVQESLSKAGIRVKLEYPELGKWSTYMGPGTTWPTNSALYTLYPAIDTSYIGGLLWLNVQLGKSWARPPELTDVLNNAVTSRDIDVKLVRTFTDMISKNSWLIPVNEGVSGFATQPYVNGFDSGVIVATYEDVWINR